MQAAAHEARSASTAAHAAREILSFRLGEEEYGMDILRVQEIRSYEAPTRIANAPAFVRGVLNLRGVIVPIIDLRLKFGLEPRFEAVTVTVVLNVAGRTIGAVVDSVSDVLQLAADQIKPPPQFTSAIDASHIIGLGSVKHGDAERLLILLDIERLMSSADMGLFEPVAA
jgi:purine-binding chemotaxis protein CheW